jgi:1,2-dihydroxy-3-keto-5-methylthiopentene dioxygenase
MKAYWFDNTPVSHSFVQELSQPAQGDQREPHDSGRIVSDQCLSKLGILHYNYPSVDDVNRVAASRGYKNRDEITISPQVMGDQYELKVKTFFNEHLHEDEEIRYILDGAGYFDVRDKDDEWVRIKLDKYDMMIMPAGIYHRFTTDESNVSRIG